MDTRTHSVSCLRDRQEHVRRRTRYHRGPHHRRLVLFVATLDGVPSSGHASRVDRSVTSGGRAPPPEGSKRALRPGSTDATEASPPVTESAVFKDEYYIHEQNDRFTNDYFIYEQGQKDIIVKNRLKEHIQFWKNIGANQFIIDSIEHGYKIPFYSLPESVLLKNNKSACDNREFVRKAITDLLDRDLVEKKQMPLLVLLIHFLYPFKVMVKSVSFWI